MTAGGIAGLSHFRTTIFSAKRLKTGVTDIGLKSEKVDGGQVDIVRFYKNRPKSLARMPPQDKFLATPMGQC